MQDDVGQPKSPLPCHIPAPSSLQGDKNLHETGQGGLEQGAITAHW